MKNSRPIFIVAALFILSAFASAQTADEIIAKYVKAIGGKEKISTINSLYIESKTQVMGMEMISKTTTLNGKGNKTEMDAMGNKIITCITDKGGWLINPMAGSGSAEDMPAEQYNSSKDQIYIGAPFLVFDKGYKAEFLGKETINGAEAFKLKVTSPDNTENIYFFDPVTGYLVQALTKGDMQGQMVENVITYSDYKSLDGYFFPYKTNINMGGQIDMTSTIINAEINKPVDTAIFIKP
ncbi:MAG: hypothetical protein JXB49_05100 [Bacteroidales bacterium]|nr:hypothetical protein [Bacteroidales bacterium]